jgi:hypothetical protein
MTSTIDELSSLILQQLHTDFASRGLSANDLVDGYVGVSLPHIKQSCSERTAASPVDFDLALKELEQKEFVATGPMVPIENSPHSSLVFIGVRSKYEFAYLTEKGYKAAQKALKTRPPRSAVASTHITISDSTFHHSPVAAGVHVAQSITTTSNAPIFGELRNAVESNEIDTDLKAALLAEIEAMRTAHNTPSFVAKYQNFLTLAVDVMKIVGPFLPALSKLLPGAHQ